MRQDRTKSATATGGGPAAAFNRDAIKKLAYEYWLNRGCPDGSADEDWIQAERTLQSSAKTAPSATSRTRKAAGEAGQAMKAAG